MTRHQTRSLGSHGRLVDDALTTWQARGHVDRLWRRDAELWTGGDEDRWLGWLGIVDTQLAQLDQIRAIAADVRDAGFTHALLLGMGGSSLCPEVLRRTFGPIEGFPELAVLDSTVPAQIRRLAAALDPARTLFIVSSKSGTTTEPNVFLQYFLDRVREGSGTEPGRHFLAITDPDTRLEQLASARGFRRVAHGLPSIGGRYSALSNFGIVPAAIMGLDVRALLERAALMVQACGPAVPAADNPGVELGVALGTLAGHGRDKITLVIPPELASLGAWLEQLLAESTGKRGRGLVPIDGERLGPPDVYGDDRVFVHLRLRASPVAEQDEAVRGLERAGHPVIRIELDATADVGQEFFRWEMATAVAGAVLGINAFDQPDVEASKIATRRLTEAFEAGERRAEDDPLFEGGGIALFADPANAAALKAAATPTSLEGYLAAHLARLGPGDYFAVNAYVDMCAAHDQLLQSARHAVRDARRVATTVGYGPRFLHSTGQLHKGGPNTGVFLQVTSDDAEDLPIPGQRYSFGQLKSFQAAGDLEVLDARERRVLRAHLSADVGTGLAALSRAIRASL